MEMVGYNITIKVREISEAEVSLAPAIAASPVVLLA